MQAIKNKKFSLVTCFLLLLCILGITNTAWASSCWCRATSQESTQLENKAQLIKQLQEQVKMVATQVQMIEKLSGQMSSKLDGANTMILGQFDNLINTWKESMSLTHVMDNFEDLHNKRHPERDDNVAIEAEAERHRRYAEWAAMMDAYLKGLNLTAKDLENAQKARQEMYDVLQSTNGQLQAIQALGAMVNHTSMILERNSQIQSAYVTMFAENVRDKDNARRDEDINLGLGFEGMRNIENEGSGHKPDIKKTLQ